MYFHFKEAFPFRERRDRRLDQEEASFERDRFEVRPGRVEFDRDEADFSRQTRGRHNNRRHHDGRDGRRNRLHVQNVNDNRNENRDALADENASRNTNGNENQQIRWRKDQENRDIRVDDRFDLDIEDDVRIDDFPGRRSRFD